MGRNDDTDHGDEPVYRQQKEMYDNRSHTCEDRIVSLEQPHVRPIQRGKRPNSTEFGQKLHLSVVGGYTFLEQTSWSSFSEGCDLEAGVEDYKRKFGCCPSAAPADKIYQTRSNRLFCSERGIRLSGPPLGHRKASETDAKIKRQMYKDSCERNAIEGRYGNAKRRFSLDRTFSKLDETAKTVAALILLAMNASLRPVRWLVLFLRSLLLPFQFLCFSVGSKEGLIKSTWMDWRANFHAPRGKKSQEYFVYLRFFNEAGRKICRQDVRGDLFSASLNN